MPIHDYKNMNKEELLEQTADLRAFEIDSQSNRLMELMFTRNQTHPRLATRADEPYEWSKSDQFKEITEMTYNASDKQEAQGVIQETEIISAELEIPSAVFNGETVLEEIDSELEKVNTKLEQYTSQADKIDYALAVGSGILAGIIDSVFTGAFSLEEASQWGNEKVNDFVKKAARTQGYNGDSLAKAVAYLEDKFPIAADKATNQFGGGLQHHLRDFSHHPSPVGLLCSVLTQFTGNVYGTDVSGAFQSVKLNADGMELIGKSFPEKIVLGTVNWMFHMASDMAGSSGSITKGKLGTGLPGLVVSLLKELSATPLFHRMNDKGYKQASVWISKLFNGTLLGERNENGIIQPFQFDLRTELGIIQQLGRQAVPVIINECVVRGFYFIRQLITELNRTGIKNPKDLAKLNWKKIVPAHNRTIDRMLTVSSLTFSIADTTDAAIRAAIESAGDWVLFSERFVTRCNYIGAGRAAFAVVREISNEQKETQLIHEKMILSEAKTAIFLSRLQEFKEQLGEIVANYLAEDLETFMSGFDDLKKGIDSGDSELVIHGNLVIQKVLGRTPQFTIQKEFDELMESDIPLKL